MKINSSISCLSLVAILCSLAGCGAVPLRSNVKTDYDVIVVGSGMGGLSAATHLANGGMDVLLLEQHFKVGGCASSFVRGEFAFDTALHEMSVGGGERGFIIDLLEEAGVLEKIEMIRVPELGRSIFPGLDMIQPNGVDEFKTVLKEKWPAEKENIDDYFELLEQMAEEMSELRDIYLGNPVKAFLTKMVVPLRQRKLTKYNNNTIQEVLDDFFEDEQLKAVIAQFWFYHGPPPSKQWSIIYMSAQYGYLKNGGWQIKGSSSSLAEAYADRFRELGGTIKTSTKVNSIIVENDKVHGVTTEDGQGFSSRYVVSNADPYQTFYKLVGEEKTPRRIVKKLKKWTPSTSLAGVYLGLDVDTSFWGIEDYEIFYNATWDYDAMHEAMMEGRYEDGMVSITFYSNLPDDFYAPEGKAAVVLHTYSDYDFWSDDETEYEAQKQDMMDRLIKMAENVLPGLRDHIEFQEGMTPKTIHHYTLNYKGAPYGMDFTVDQSKRMNIETGIGGMYLAGSWAFPSHSVGMAQASGYLAAKLILKKDDRE